jgi:hypothetical protein
LLIGAQGDGNESLMARKSQSGWRSMAGERQLIEMAKTKTLDAIAKTLQRPSAIILEKAGRLGLSIKQK